METLPCIVLRKDLEGRFTFANQRFLELSGPKLEDLLGKTDYGINPPDGVLAEKYPQDDRRVMETGGVFEDIEDLIFRGATRYFHTLKTPTRDADGNITGVQLISWDVTARKTAEDELARLRGAT